MRNRHRTARADNPRLTCLCQAALIIVDEISMVSKKLFAQLHQELCKYAARDIASRAEPFAGKNLLLAGDFHQLWPVRATPIPVAPSPRERNNELIVLGYRLWVDSVQGGVFLRRSMRAQGCEIQQNLCTAIRNGCLADSEGGNMLRALNARRLVRGQQAAVASQATSSYGAQWPRDLDLNRLTIISPTNKLRAQFQDFAIAEYALQHPAEVLYYIPAVVHRTRGEVTGAMRDAIKACRLNSLDNLPPVLMVARGMKVMVTSNESAQHMVMNGTHAIVEDVVFAQNVEFHDVEHQVSFCALSR